MGVKGFTLRGAFLNHENYGNNCQTKKHYLLNEIFLSVVKEMYKVEYREYGY